MLHEIVKFLFDKIDYRLVMSESTERISACMVVCFSFVLLCFCFCSEFVLIFFSSIISISAVNKVYDSKEPFLNFLSAKFIYKPTVEIYSFTKARAHVIVAYQ